MVSRIVELIDKNKFEVNATARYRLLNNIFVFKDIDEKTAQDFGFMLDNSNYDEIKSLAYKDVNGVRIYFKLNNDAIYLYADGTGYDNVLEFLDMQKLSKAFNFVYTDIDLIGVANQCNGINEFVQVLLQIGAPYHVIQMEPLLGNVSEMYSIVCVDAKQEIYDFKKKIFGMAANEYIAKMRNDYRILGSTR